MGKLKVFVESIQAFALFCGFYLEKYLEKKLIDDSASKPIIISIFAFLGLVLFLKIAEALAEWALNKWQWLRKLILGDSYIEGIWFNTVPLHSPLYGLLRIEIRDGSVLISGEQYDTHGNLTVTWHSDMSKFDGRILEYAYTSTYSKHGQEHETRGISQISFAKVSTSGSGAPRYYNGHFRDFSGNQEICGFSGFRLSKDIEKKLDNYGEKVSALKTLIESLAKEEPTKE